MKTLLLLLLCLNCLALRPAPGFGQADPSAAALAANHQGVAADAKGDFPAAIAAFRNAIHLDPNQRPFVTNLASAYGKAGRWPEAQALLQTAWGTFTAQDDRKKLAAGLADIDYDWAEKLKATYQFQESLTHRQAALALDRAYRPDDVALDLYCLGSVSERLTQYSQAIAYYQEALGLKRATGDRSSEFCLLNNLGTLHITLGQYDKAIEFHEQALAIERDLKDRKDEAITLSNLGVSWDHLGQSKKAIGFFEQSLRIWREVKDREGEATTLANVGAAYFGLRQYEKAIGFYDQSLRIDREAGNIAGQASTLSNWGTAYEGLGRFDKAIECLQQALPLRREALDRAGEIETLSGLLGAWDAQKDPELAIWYGKQAITLLQGIRGDLSALDPPTQKAYLASHESDYRLLAEVLIDQGRLSEALQVLGLLKQEEFFDFLGRDPKAAPSLTGKVCLTAQEAKWQGQYARLAKNKPMAPFLAGLTKAFASGAAEEKISSVSEARLLSAALGKMPAGTVAIYTIVEPDQIRLVVVTSDTQRAASFPIKAADLYRKVLAFRNALQDPTRDPRAPAQELYKMLIGPIKPDLEKAHATTLLWSLDDALRYLPISALYDGDHYLVERYDNCVLTLAGPAQIAQAPHAAPWTALGLGVSQEHPGFDALPGVRAELAGIIGPVVPGISLLDGQFTQASFLAGLKRRDHPLVHIASHFSLSGRDTDSFLLLGDGGHLSLAQIKADPNIFAGVDLLTLSACNTAMEVRSAGGREVEGFGALAQRLGARSVLASLWPVADASTPVLMREFYRLRRTRPALSKAAGLRQAQTELLRGQAAAVSLPQATGSRAYRAKIAGAANTSLPLFVADPKAPYAHPYYWAPFVLIGNPQ